VGVLGREGCAPQPSRGPSICCASRRGACTIPGVSSHHVQSDLGLVKPFFDAVFEAATDTGLHPSPRLMGLGRGRQASIMEMQALAVRGIEASGERYVKRTNPLLLRIVEACAIRRRGKVRANDQHAASTTARPIGEGQAAG
jgi:hypothetical protein